MNNNKSRQLAQALCHEFAQVEGRQPRILVGSDPESSMELLRETCNTLADLGFNVDMAPGNSSFESLVLQCAENDADIFLLIATENTGIEDLNQLQKKILAIQPDAVLSVLTEKSVVEKQLLKTTERFLLFDTTMSLASVGLALLRNLFEADA